uniref:uncharacterized protein LOC122596378 isoform X2 n=1 Tax=Erigeron canadensis TaxID=72917 RepID=UPI001CB8B2C7|nr:uncharacterized protein LOC122596378 isoform X2 [Erigeron canadensis]
MTFPSPKPWPRTGTSTVAQQRLYAQQHGIKILDKDVLSKARGQPTAEERKAKRIEEAIAHKRYLGLDPSEAETGVETEANVMPRPPHPYITVASYTGQVQSYLVLGKLLSLCNKTAVFQIAGVGTNRPTTSLFDMLQIRLYA